MALDFWYNEAEKKEQAELRSAYIASVRNNLRGQLNQISIQNEDGSITIPEVLWPYMGGTKVIVPKN